MTELQQQAAQDDPGTRRPLLTSDELVTYLITWLMKGMHA